MGFLSLPMVLAHGVFAGCDDFHVVWVEAYAVAA